MPSVVECRVSIKLEICECVVGHIHCKVGKRWVPFHVVHRVVFVLRDDTEREFALGFGDNVWLD